jgi:hypothetical protein
MVVESRIWRCQAQVGQEEHELVGEAAAPPLGLGCGFILTETLRMCSFDVSMNTIADARVLGGLEEAQRGVLSKGDLQTALGERHPAAFVRRVDALLEHGVLRRFCRGWYVTEGFDLATLSQRLAPESVVSFTTVLARHLIVGPSPEGRIVAVKTGRPRRYTDGEHEIEHVSVAPGLLFGFSTVDGVRIADPEKALLDTLYFHLRGRRFPFDVYSDIEIDRLDRDRVKQYLERYRNPRFVSFVRGVLAS